MIPSSAAQQEMSNQTLETILVCTKPNNNNIINNVNGEDHHQKKKQRPDAEKALKCPRCESTNTKFCYYNNYSLSQPRYFCKSCRRYWTNGGTLRNVPVGGGCRKYRRSSSSSSKNTITMKPNFHDQPLHNPLITGLPSLGGYDSVDLNIVFARLQHSNSQSSTEVCDVFGNSSGMFGGQNGNFNGSYGFMMMGVDDRNDNTDTKATSMAMAFEERNINKQEDSINGNNENPSKVLRGFPWRMNGEVPGGGGGGGGGGGAPEIDAGRESWNGLSSSWHGLLNSPLM